MPHPLTDEERIEDYVRRLASVSCEAREAEVKAVLEHPDPLGDEGFLHRKALLVTAFRRISQLEPGAA